LESIAFGRFRIVPRRRELLADDERVKLGERAFDLLMVLIETPGAVVSKDELLARVWPDRVVAETSLQAQILALRQAPGAPTTAKDHFEQALAWARRQGALSWELRAATSFARLLRDQGRPADAAAELQPVYDRFIEGFDTVDLKTAKAVLQDLR
jgi:hypothetical protein